MYGLQVKADYIIHYWIFSAIRYLSCLALGTFEHAILCSKEQKDWKLAYEFESKQFYSSKGEVLGFVNRVEMRRSCNMGDLFLLLNLHPRQAP